MEYVARSPVMGESSAVLVAYLGVLTALAQGEDGAQARPGVAERARAAVPRPAVRAPQAHRNSTLSRRGGRPCSSNCARATGTSRCPGRACWPS